MTDYHPSEDAIEAAATEIEAISDWTPEHVKGVAINALTAALAIDGPRIRRKALEEAATLCDDYARNGRLSQEFACETADEIAARIHALEEMSK